MSDRLSYAEKEELPTSVYGLPERREYPMPDAAHVRAAEAYFRYCPEELKPELADSSSVRRRITDNILLNKKSIANTGRRVV